MRIQELRLVAFGPFVDKPLVFDEAGIHVIYGPNEAGKSSALQGLKALLYGIEERTRDNFLHDNDRAVCARPRHCNGVPWSLSRPFPRRRTVYLRIGL
jgi:DNA repair exonuclease SbcCD ATPase subunit